MNASFDTFTESLIHQLKRSEQLEGLGFTDNAASIESEWDGCSAPDTFYLSVDSFVKA